jgi:hypothetical protein
MTKKVLLVSSEEGERKVLSGYGRRDSVSLRGYLYSDRINFIP